MSLRLFSLALMLLLAGCSTAGLDVRRAPHGLAPLRDDIAGMLVVFDLPRGLGAPSHASVLTFAAPGVAPVRALLLEADADAIAAGLPAPATGHAYYIFGLGPADQGALRAAQAVARAAHATDADVSVTVTPRLCRSAGTDLGSATVSVFAALPGPAALTPLIDRRPLADVAGAAALPAC